MPEVEHHWVGWYSQLGANMAKPSTIRWTRGPTGDSFAQVKRELERKHPGRVYQIMVRGGSPGRPPHNTGDGPKKPKAPAQRVRNPWTTKRARVLSIIANDWISTREIADAVAGEKVTQPPPALRELLLQLTNEGLVERRLRPAYGRGADSFEYRRAARAM